MNYDNVPATQWQQWSAENGAVILDVREPMEWALGTLPDSMKMSMRDIPGRIHELDKNTPVLVVCRSGNRSQAGRDILLANGYEPTTSMAGGLNAWREAGYPIE